MRALAIFSLLLLALGSITIAEQIDIDKIVSQLGAGDFKVREEAEAVLRGIGQPARAALERAAQSSDPELKIRARTLLAEIMSGIPASCPDSLRDKLRSFNLLSTEARDAVISDLLKTCGADKSLPFLFAQLGAEDETIAALAYKTITSLGDDDKIYSLILDGIDNPGNTYETKLLVTAVLKTKKPDYMLRVLKLDNLTDGQRSSVVREAVKFIRDKLEDGNNLEADKLAKAFLVSAPDDARLTYLRAIALLRMGSRKECEKLMRKGFSMSGDEGDRYKAGELLLELGYLRQSEKEWLEILKIPPKDGVYDLNAYLRLGDIYAKSEMYGRAAEMLETGQKKYEAAKEKAGSSMGMIGAETLDGKIAELRRLASDDEPEVVPETTREDILKIRVKSALKKGEEKDLIKDLQAADAELSAEVQPHGLRLFEKTNAGVSYDAEASQLRILLNGSPCAEGEAFVMKKDKARVVLKSLDMLYIFEVDRETGEAQRLKSYEFDYEAFVYPSAIVQEWKDVKFKFNNKEYSWEELEKGIDFDYLPPKFDINLEGTSSSGKKIELHQTLDPKEMLVPLRLPSD